MIANSIKQQKICLDQFIQECELNEDIYEAYQVIEVLQSDDNQNNRKVELVCDKLNPESLFVLKTVPSTQEIFSYQEFLNIKKLDHPEIIKLQKFY